MNNKKRLLNVVQIWTLFLFTSFSLLGILSFTDPKISSFWSMKNEKTFAEFENEDDEEIHQNEKKSEKEEEENTTIIHTSSWLTVKQKYTLSSLIDTKIKKSTQIEKTKILNELIEKMNTQILNLKLLQSKRDKPDTYKKLENKIQIYTQIKNILISKKTPKTEIVVKKIDEKFQKISSYKAKNGKIYKIIENWSEVTIQKQDGSFAKQTFPSYLEAVAYLDKNAILPPKVVIKLPIEKIVTPIPEPVITQVVVPKPVTPPPVVDTKTKAS